MASIRNVHTRLQARLIFRTEIHKKISKYYLVTLISMGARHRNKSVNPKESRILIAVLRITTNWDKVEDITQLKEIRIQIIFLVRKTIKNETAHCTELLF